jgi:hypothetical protein
MTDDRGASKLIPGLARGGINAIRSGELGLQGELQCASTPQAECLVDDSAAIQFGVSGDIDIDAGQQVWIDGGGDFGTATSVGRGRHGTESSGHLARHLPVSRDPNFPQKRFAGDRLQRRLPSQRDLPTRLRFSDSLWPRRHVCRR